MRCARIHASHDTGSSFAQFDPDFSRFDPTTDLSDVAGDPIRPV